MCGIVGYIGKKQAAPILLEGLKKLEYRGYDSAGIAVRDRTGEVTLVKAKGRLSRLIERTQGGASLEGTCGIGHTRWATHGEPTEENAHPHKCPDGAVTVVHNGILENYRELKQKLVKNGYEFYSQTDTEIIADLIDHYYKKYRGPIEALVHFMARARGSYAIAVLFRDDPDAVYIARKDGPIIVGMGEGESFIASDVPAILKYTRQVYYLGNLELARVEAGSVRFFNIDREEVEREPVTIDMTESDAEKGGWEHFMMKEIHEQPAAVRNTLDAYLHGDEIDFSESGLSLPADLEGIAIVACGSAYHVGVTLQYVIEALARVPVRVELASEFRYRDPVLRGKTLVIAISQSGETADTLAALREAKERGVPTAAIVNVRGSSIAREADHVLYTHAGIEIAVATTKAYSAQLIVGYLLAVELGRRNGSLSGERVRACLAQLRKLPEAIGEQLAQKEFIQRFAAEHAHVRDVFMIGRGVDYTVCLEGALKLKEISYVHTEAYAAGELKHGTISLIEDGTLVIGVMTGKKISEKTQSNLEEVRTRGAEVVSVGFGEDADIRLPDVDPLFAASVAVIPFQLFAYYTSLQRGLDVDKPRHLAKSVTVE